jgi:hypothetical protein
MENIKEQFKELYSSIASTTFKDGPYEYDIRLVLGSLTEDNDLIGLNIHVHNFPDYVGSDLLVYTLGHLVDTKSEILKNPDISWILAKVTMDSLTNVKDISNSIFPSIQVDDFLPFNQFSKTILDHKDEKIDLNKIKETIQSRITKLTKALEHLKNTYQVEKEELKKFEPFNMTYDITSNIRLVRDNMVPGLKVVIKFKPSSHLFHTISYRLQAELKKDILETLGEISPIDFNAYDEVSIKFI